jgi:hypothetical protein
MNEATSVSSTTIAVDLFQVIDFFFYLRGNLQRLSYNTRYFSGNYGIVIALLAVYAL